MVAIVGPLVLPGGDPAPILEVGVLLVGIASGSMLLLILMVMFVALPIAIYFDAREIASADLAWSLDPVLNAVLAALQFVVTPVAGRIVAFRTATAATRKWASPSGKAKWSPPPCSAWTTGSAEPSPATAGGNT